MQANPYAAPPPRKGMPGWLVALLVTVVVLVLVVPIMAVLAIYGVRKYISNSKTVEARNNLGQIARGASNAYDRESVDDTGKGVEHRVCPSASRSVPASPSMIRGAKYQSSASDWSVDKASDAGFSCLKFSMDWPQYYMYSYRSTPTDFTATANGDLNGDGVLSTFTVTGRVSGGALQIAPNIMETDPQE